MHAFYIAMGILAIIVLVAALIYTRKQFSGNKELIEHFRQDPNSILAGAPPAQAPPVQSRPSGGTQKTA